jgi:hypothetical protein
LPSPNGDKDDDVYDSMAKSQDLLAETQRSVAGPYRMIERGPALAGRFDRTTKKRVWWENNRKAIC